MLKTLLPDYSAGSLEVRQHVWPEFHPAYHIERPPAFRGLNLKRPFSIALEPFESIEFTSLLTQAG